MKKLGLVLAALLVLVILAPAAVAHGGCSLSSPGRPTHNSQTVTYGGAFYSCNNTHDSISVGITLQRRPGGGGTWSNVANKMPPAEGPNDSFAQVSAGTFPWDCAKDYRLYETGVASPGGHSGAQPSAVLENTC